MKKKGVFLLFALSVMAITGCGNQNTNGNVGLETVTEEESEEVLLDQPIATTTEEPTTRIVSEKEKATSEEETSQVNNDTSIAGTGSLSQAGGITAITPDDAADILIKTLGEKDKETGNEYSYNYVETVQVDGATYFVFDWRWMVDGDHMSRLGDLFVTADGAKIYEGVYNGSEDSTVNLDNPLN